MVTTKSHEASKDRKLTLRPRSLQSKLILFASALVIVPGLLYGLVAYQSGSRSLEQAIGRQLAREAGHTAERLSARLDGEVNALRALAAQDVMREIRVDDIDKRISSALGVLRAGDSARLEYLVVDRAQRVVASSAPRSIGATVPRTQALEVALAGGDRLEGPIPRREEAPARLAIAVPVLDPDGDHEVIGALMGIYDWRVLTAVGETIRRELSLQGLETQVLLVREDGRLVGGAPPGSDVAIRERSDWSAWTASPSDVRGVYMARDGLLVGRAPVRAKLAHWQLLIAEPLDDALAPVRGLSRRLGLILGVLLGGAVMLAALASRRVSRPLGELSVALRSLSRGEDSAFRAPVRSDDEVGTVARAFNQMASALDQAQRDLVEAAKFAFVGELAGGVAHQVRTSLGVLRSSAQMLVRSVVDGAKGDASELAQLIRTEVDRLEGVVNDLLDLARPRALHLEATPLDVPVFRAMDAVEPQARERGVELIRRREPRPAVAHCDRELIYQVALNLLVNAVQALDEGGHIEVRVGADRAQAGLAVFEVRDDGPGIPEELRDSVFGPFVTAREGGVGLGLTFVKRMVHEHGGRIHLLSPDEGGACFRVELPEAGGQFADEGGITS